MWCEILFAWERFPYENFFEFLGEKTLDGERFIFFVSEEDYSKESVLFKLRFKEN